MIALQDVAVTFNKGTPLESVGLRGVNLTVPKGQFLTVIGSNGAGKSTTLNVIAGLIRADRGHVVVDGLDITTWTTDRRAPLISRVFQDPKMGTCEDLTILENLALAHARTRPRWFRFAIDSNVRQDAIDRLKLLQLGLEDRLDDKVGLLSGGQRQALSLLMATTGNTRVLLLDEPTAALDPKTGEFVMELADTIIKKLDLTVILVTHSMAQALSYGQRTVMFHRGQIVFDIQAAERRAMQVRDLLDLFKRDQGDELVDDGLLLD
jgi:putative ABC transport system ATP-binding protein